jgi:hypothetical protein
MRLESTLTCRTARIGRRAMLSDACQFSMTARLRDALSQGSDCCVCSYGTVPYRQNRRNCYLLKRAFDHSSVELI